MGRKTMPEQMRGYMPDLCLFAIRDDEFPKCLPRNRRSLGRHKRKGRRFLAQQARPDSEILPDPVYSALAQRNRAFLTSLSKSHDESQVKVEVFNLNCSQLRYSQASCIQHLKHCLIPQA